MTEFSVIFIVHSVALTQYKAVLVFRLTVLLLMNKLYDLGKFIEFIEILDPVHIF